MENGAEAVKPTPMTRRRGQKHKPFLAADSSLFALKVIFLSLSSNVIPLNNSAQAFPPSGLLRFALFKTNHVNVEKD